MQRILRMDANESCYGPSPRAVRAAADALCGINLYPDDSNPHLRRALTDRFGVPADQIIFGNGSSELIELIARAYLRAGQNSVTADSTFVLFRPATEWTGAQCREIPLRDWKFDLEAIRSAIDENTRIIYIANPNNPTGTHLPPRELEAFLNDVPSHVVTVLDQAYFEFTEDPNDLPEREGVIVLRTFSKIYGLAGLRIGYGVASKKIIEHLDRVRSQYNINSVAQAAALAALEDPDHIRTVKAKHKQERSFMETELSRIGIPFVPSITNFMLLLVSNPEETCNDLRQYGIRTRLVKPGIRVTLGTHNENLQFLEALKSL